MKLIFKCRYAYFQVHIMLCKQFGESDKNERVKKNYVKLKPYKMTDKKANKREREKPENAAAKTTAERRRRRRSGDGDGGAATKAKTAALTITATAWTASRSAVIQISFSSRQHAAN